MNATHELERRLAAFYASEAPQRAPERVLEAVLATTEITTQRRSVIGVPWRFPIMNSYARVAIAAVAVIAIGAVGLAVLQPGSSPGIGTPASPGPSDDALPSPLPSLSETFTSAFHGVSLSYPAGWVPRAATETWSSSEAPFFGSPFADVMYDAALEDHLFLSVQSQPLAGASGNDWANEITNESGWDDPCPPTLEPITIDGADDALLSSCTGSIPRAMAWTADRGYLILIYGSDDVAGFREILATVRLHPEDAVAAAEPPVLTETFSSPVHGISVSYPAGWITVPATDPESTAEPGFLNPGADFIHDPTLRDHLFIALGSGALNGQAGEDWATALMNDPESGCDGERQPITVADAPGLICGTLALAWVGDQGYEIQLYVSPDQPSVGEAYDRSWFDDVLATVQLDPGDAATP